MTKRIYLTMLTVLFAFTALFAQNPEVKVGTVTSGPGEVLVPVDMLNFDENVNSFTLWIHANKSLVEYKGITNVEGFITSNFQVFHQADNILRIVWYDMGDGYKPNGHVFDIKFNYTAAANVPLEFMTGDCEVSYDVIPVPDVVYTNGMIKTTAPLPDPVVKIDDVIALPGTVNVGVEMLNFVDDVDAITFFINLPTELVTFIDITNLHPGFGADSWVKNVENGILKLEWHSDGSGFTPSGHVFDIVFHYTGGFKANLTWAPGNEVAYSSSPIDNISYIKGSITQGDAVGAVTIGTVDGISGEQVSVPVSFLGAGFTDVAGITLFLQFDDSKLNFIGTSNPFDSEIESNIDGNEIRLEWHGEAADMTDVDMVFLDFVFTGVTPADLWFVPGCEIAPISAIPYPVEYVNGQVIPVESNANITIPEVEGLAGQLVSVPVLAEEIGEVGAVSLRINFDNTKLTLVQYSFSQLEGWVPLQGDDFLNVGWFDEDGDLLADGEILVLDFVYHGGGTAPITFGDDCEISGPSAASKVVNFNNGAVVAGTSEAKAIIGTVNECEGGTAIVPVSFVAMGDVTAITLPISFDPEVLTFVQLDNIHPALAEAYELNFNSNTVNVAWTSEEGVELDGKLFDLVFAYHGMVSAITFLPHAEVAGLGAIPMAVEFVNGEVDCNIEDRVLTLNINGNGSVVVKDGEDILLPDEGTENEFTVFYGTVLTLEATGDEGWEFIEWEGSVSNLTEPITTIAMINDFEVTANFDLIDYTLELIANPENGGEVEGAGIYNFQDEVTVVATPNEGWEFINWTNEEDEVVSEDATYVFSYPSRDLTLTANFEMIDYELVLIANPEEGGEVEGAGIYNFQDEVTVIATPNEGWEFISWTDEEDEVVSEEATYVFSYPSRDLTLTANFAMIDYELVLIANPEEGGELEGAGIYNFQDEVTVVATPNEGWDFISWTDEEDVVVSEEATYVFDYPSRDLTLTANFEMIDYELVLVADPEEGGEVEGAGVYNFGDEVEVAAEANQGWAFVNWTDGDDVVSEEAEFTFTMPAADVTLTANFEVSEFDLVLIANPEQAGTVVGAGTYTVGEEIEISAVAADYWAFLNWTDGDEVVSTEADFTFTMPAANVTLVANFEFTYVAEFPFLEDFEGTNPPLGWNTFDFGTGTQRTWQPTTSQNHTLGGSYAYYHNYGPSGVAQEGWLVTPKVALPAGENIQLSFWSYNQYPNVYGKNSVLISNGLGHPLANEFVEIWSPATIVGPWTETVLDLSSYAGQDIYVAFVYEGTFAHAWFIDDVAIDVPLLAPAISVTPMELEETLHRFDVAVQQVTVTNTGEDVLDFSVVVNTGERTVASPNTAEDFEKLSSRLTDEGRDYGTLALLNKGDGKYDLPKNPKDQTVLRYDGPNADNAIGAGGAPFIAAAYWPASTMGQYSGMQLENVEVFILDPVFGATLKIYGQGTASEPGQLLYEQAFSPTDHSWNNVELDDPVEITGEDFWVGYEVEYGEGLFPAGVDEGPAVNGFGNMVYLQGEWMTLLEASATLNYNWNIAAFLGSGVTYANDVGVQQLLSPSSNIQLGDETVIVRVKNYGTEPQSNIAVSYSFEGGAPVTGTITGPLAPGATFDYTFAGTVDLGIEGQTYEFEVCAIVAGDENPANDCRTIEVTHIVAEYCDASTTNTGEYIARVQIGTIDNSSEWQGGVADYTDQYTLISAGFSEEITVTNGSPWASDKVTVWVDWNANYEFDVGTEEEYVLVSEDAGATFKGDILVPAGTPAGTYRMRIRLTYSLNPTPCGVMSYGEVEDYSIKVGEGVPWLYATPLSGSLAGGESTTIEVTFDATDTQVGTYEGSLVFNSNDPENPSVVVPATLNVVPSELPAPRNVAVVAMTNSAIVQWLEPNFGTLTDLNLVSYTILRDGEQVGSVPADEFFFYEDAVTAGNVTYGVIAVYEEPYPGESDMVTAAGTVFDPITEIPYANDFETDFSTTGWFIFDEDGNTNVRTWAVSTTQSHSPTTSMFHNYGPSAQYEDGWLISRKIQLPASGDLELSFWSYNSFPTYYDKNSVLISTDRGYPASEDFVEVWSPDAVTAAWSQASIDISGYAGQAVYIAFRYQGSNAHAWYLDDLEVKEAVFAPEISVTPISLHETLMQGETSTKQVTVTNMGTADLEFELEVLTERRNPAREFKPDYARVLERMEAEGYTVLSKSNHSGAAVPAPNAVAEEILRYDNGVNDDAIGLNGGGTFEVSAYWPASSMGQYSGMVLEKVSMYINSVPSAAKLKIYGPGSSAAPGALIHEQVFTATGSDWNMIELSDPVEITGDDIWIGYEVTHGDSQWPAGCDAGPAAAGFGDMIALNNAWDPISSLGFDVNWNIAAYLEQGASYTTDVGVQQLVNPVSGVGLSNDEPVTIRVKNYGTTPQSNIPVSYSLDGGPLIMGTIDGPVAPGATADFTFGMNADLGVEGQTYSFHICALIPGDENPANNCKTVEVTHMAPAYCDATTSSGNYEYITRVQFGDIDNSSGWQGGVADYTDQYTIIDPGASEAITITNSNEPDLDDFVTVWVDWNQNYVYEQGTDEEYFLVSNDDGVTFVGNISVPAGVAGGDYRMRVRMTWGWDKEPEPCGNAMYGEVEEYTIRVSGAPAGDWLTATPLSGVVPAGESMIIDVNFDATGLAVGTYEGGLVFTSNDGANPVVAVPVTLDVEESNICYPAPRNLTDVVEGQDVTLSWQAPDLGGGGTGPVEDFYEDFESGTLPTGWVVYDVDGDGHIWDNTATLEGIYSAHSGLYCMASASYVNDLGALNPDNWLVTPAIKVTADSELKFWVAAQDPAYSNDQYYVRISTTGNAVANFTETIHSALTPQDWAEVVLDLGAYAGQTIYIAFVHADCTDWFYAKIDDVTVTNTESRAAYTAPVAANPIAGLSYREGGSPAAPIANGSSEPLDISLTRGEPAPVVTGIKHQSGTSARSLLFDNGPFVNAPGQGAGGADVSHLHSGQNTFGPNMNQALDYFLADDFVVDETWTIESLTFYAYQTGSTTTSTFTGGYVQILDAAPDAGGQVVWGDLTTNLMASTAWTNAYRTNETALTNTDRPIMQIVCATPDLVLEPGTYWVVFGVTGSGASGPWGVPVTITGQINTGNAKQLTADGWVDLEDSGTFSPYGMAFIIEGETGGTGGPGCEHGELLGYNVYRNNVKIGETVANVRTYLDANVDPGTYTYGVSAVYGQPYPGESDIITRSVEVLPATSPVITVNPASLYQHFFAPGDTETQILTIGNTGDGALEWSAAVQYTSKTVVHPPVPEGPVTNAYIDLSVGEFEAGGSPALPETREDIILHYDGENQGNAIGLTGGGDFHVSARFPAAMVSGYSGFELKEVDVFVNDMPTSMTLYIRGAGTTTAPGTVLHQQTLNPTNGWNTFVLSTPVILDGNDLWVGYQVSHAADQFPAGCDGGPADPNGDWLSMDGNAWQHMADLGLDYNWNIRALISGSAWLTLGTSSGTVAPGANQQINVYFDSEGLEIGAYTANILISSNDLATPVKTVPVQMDVGVGVEENDMANVQVYPVPANSILFIDLVEGVRQIRMMNIMGQIVKDETVNGELRRTLDLTGLQSGTYTLQFINDKGQVHHKTIVISR